MRKALITGITGQDGSYLTELLIEKGYSVHGMVRRSSSVNTGRIDHIPRDGDRIQLHYGDLTDSNSMMHIIQKIQPDEIYNLAAQSHVQISFEKPEYTADSNALGILRILEAVRILGMDRTTRIYQASTSELYGKVQETPQRETTPFYPRSPYGVSKLYAFWIVKNYRESYGMYACNGILFNHESPRRGENFVTKKITRAVARIALGEQGCLYLGNLGAKRDWGFAGDYVEGMWRMLQQPAADDYVLSSGKTTTVREFVSLAFEEIGTSILWEGQEENEIGRDAETGDILVRVDPRYFRPAEVDILMGDATKAHKVLGWEPQVNLQELVRMMVRHDLKEVRQEIDMRNMAHA